MQSPTNSFLVNISVADIGMALFNCLPSFLFMRDSEWVFGAVWCTVCQFSSYLTISVSVLTLLAITRERYKVIMTPLAPRTKKLSMLKIIVLVWLIAALVSLPPALYSDHLSIINEYVNYQ